jgi:hypothetical protein
MTAHAMLYTFKAFCHYASACCAAFVAASARPPTTEWEWITLIVGSQGAGFIALKAYLSEASSKP